jgi:hypothetical protein
MSVQEGFGKVAAACRALGLARASYYRSGRSSLESRRIHKEVLELQRHKVANKKTKLTNPQNFTYKVSHLRGHGIAPGANRLNSAAVTFTIAIVLPALLSAIHILAYSEVLFPAKALKVEFS